MSIQFEELTMEVIMHEIYTMHPLDTMPSDCCVSPMEPAQAYVCPQKFDGVFPPEESLRMGTVFPSLSRPYNSPYQPELPNSAPQELSLQEKLLYQITILDFVAVDLQLFLNTHPQCTEALQMYNNTIEAANSEKAQYEKKYGPLTGFRTQNTPDYTWLNEPWPWQVTEGGA
jgi:spore coat protein JB